MENTWHQHILRVHYQDTDQMAVAHHANYVGWFEIGRTEMMRNAGIAYSNMEKLDLLLPVVDMSIQYRRPAHYDESLAVFTRVASFSAVRLQFEYEVRRIGEEPIPSNNTVITPYGELLSKGTTMHMWINREWKPARIDKVAPDVFTLLNKKFSSEGNNNKK